MIPLVDLRPEARRKAHLALDLLLEPPPVGHHYPARARMPRSLAKLSNLSALLAVDRHLEDPLVQPLEDPLQVVLLQEVGQPEMHRRLVLRRPHLVQDRQLSPLQPPHPLPNSADLLLNVFVVLI